MIISHSGIHEISLIDYPVFISKFEQTVNKDGLAYDLRFLQGIRERIRLKGNGPRSVCLKGDQVYVLTCLSDILNLYHPQEYGTIAMDSKRVETAVHKGERYFDSHKVCFWFFVTFGGKIS